MGARSSTEPQSPQAETTAAGDSQDGSPGRRTPTEAAAEAGEPADPSKILHKNGQISSINEITKEHMEFSHEPEVLKEQQAVHTEEVGETKAADLTQEEESTEEIKTSPSELSAKSNEDEVQKDTEDANKASEEKEDQAGVSPSNDVGFKKFFKLIGFKFTVKKDKTEKAEPVQLLDVKPEVAEESSDVAGDYKQSMTETVGEAPQSDIPASVDKTEEETQAEEMKGEISSEKVTESPVEAESKEAEIQNNGIKSPDSPVSPSTAETASPLRKFFTQSWAGFRKRTSFRKPKEEVQSEKEKQEQEMEKEVTAEGIIVEEELEKEKLTPEKDGTKVSFQASDEKMESEKERKEEMVEVPSEIELKEAAAPSEQPSADEPAENINKDISFEASDEKMESEKEKKEETKMVEVPSETELKEAATPSEQPSAEEPTEYINKEISFEASDEKIEREKERKEETKMVEASSETDLKEATIPKEQPPAEELAENIKEMDIILEGETDFLESKEKLEQVQKRLVGVEQSTVAWRESKTELLNEEKITQLDSLSPVAIEQPEEPFEIIEEKSEAKAPLATEVFDEKPREINIDVRAVVTVEEPQATKKEQLVLEQLVETKDEFQKEQPTIEQSKVTETVLQIGKERFIQADPSSLDTAAGKPLEGLITSEVELLSSQEKTKMQGSPLKKLFTGPGLKKLSRKKRKGKKEAKPGEAAEEAQPLSDTAESPDDPRGESSASSPEEITESIEKASEAVQISEAEEGVPSDAEKKSVTPWASFKKMVTPKKRARRLSEGDREEELDQVTESAPNDQQEDIKENGEEQKIERSADEPKKRVDTSVSWEAFICVGSSKRRSRKSSSSDEEAGQRLAQDEQKLDENASNKEAVHDTIFTNSNESDQGQGSSSPEQAGSPSETEGISTWESFKRLVTPRRKSKTRVEEKNDEPTTTVPSLEQATLDGDTGKEESWVSFKKLMPGRRKKKSDGIPEHAPVLEAGEEMTGTNEEDFDVPAVVPLSEYDAAEQEKCEAQKARQDDKETPSQNIEKSEHTSITQQVSEGLVHAVAVSVLEGERAIISIEERSPSWIPAAVTESPEHENDDEEQSEQVSGSGIVEERAAVTKPVPQMRKDISGDSIIGDQELTSEAVTAREEASVIEETTEMSCAKETIEMSCAEETTEMVSAVSRLTDSPDTTEIATPVQEIEENEQDLEELNKETQEMLQIVAERIKLPDEKGSRGSLAEVTIQPLSAEEETEQNLMTSEGIPSTEFPKDVQLETIESRAYKMVQVIIENAVAQCQQTFVVLSKQKGETTVLYPDPEKVALSGKIDSVLKESAGTRNGEGALQMGASGSPQEMELPKSSSDEETEEKVRTSQGIPSTGFPKEVQPETIVSQAYKMVQVIIENAFAQFHQESMALLKQRSEIAILGPDLDAKAFSEKIDALLAGGSTREGALQMGASGSPPEMELPKSSSDEEIEHKVITSEGISSTDFPKDVQPETIESRAYKVAQIIIENAFAQFQQEPTVLLKQKSETAVLYPDPDKVAFSEKLDSVLEESPGKCIREGALQVGTSVSPSEMELPKSSSNEEAEQKLITSEGIPSTDFPKDFQPGTTESQAYKIAQIIIQNVVAQFRQESTVLSKQECETAVLSPDPDKLAFSEKIDSMLEESPGKSVREAALQVGTSVSPSEMELPKSSSVEEAEQKVIMISEGIPSIDCPKDDPPETIEPQSLKIVQKMSAVAQLQQESMALSKQKSETAVLYPDPDKVSFSEKIDSVLEESPGKCTGGSVLQVGASGSLPKMELPTTSLDEEIEQKVIMTSEGIPSAEFPEELEGRCNREGALQTGTFGSPPEMEMPTSSTKEEAEQKLMTLEGVPTSTDFPKEVQPETTEPEAYKIVQKIIHYAVAQLQQESMALSKQKSETAVLQPDPDKLAFSEKIDSVVEESAERCTRGSVLQIGASGLHPEMKLPTSSADEETVINSKGIPSTELPKEVQPETTESQAYKIAQIIIQNVVAQFQQESMAFLKPKSETAVLCPDPDAVAFSEKIDSELEEQSPEKGTREDALQMGASGSPPEVELPKSSPDEEIEEKVMTSTEIPSTEFPKSAHSEAIESQAYKIVQIIIRNAVAQFQQESMALSKQKRTTVVMYPDPDAAAFSEKIDSMLEGASGERALQMGISGSPSEMELPTSSADDETEEKTVTSAGIPSTEFRKDILPETVESRAYKIVQIIIENAVAQFKRESMTFSKQKSETAVPYPDPGKVAFSEKIDPVLEESAGRCTREDSLQTGALGSPPETKLQKTSFEEKTEENVMALEGIPSTEFPEESGGRCTREGAFLMGTSVSPSEMELPKSSSVEEAEQKVIMISEGIPSIDCPKDDPPETIEPQSLKIVQKMSAVAQLQQESMALSKQKSETAVLYPDPDKVSFSEKIDSVLEESPEKCTGGSVLQVGASGSLPKMELPTTSLDEEIEQKVIMTSEGIPSAEFPEELEGRCNREGALQTGTFGSPPEMEMPTSSTKEEAEQKLMTLEGVPTSTDFPKEVQPETTEPEAYKIVQKIIHYAVAQLQQESMALSKQKSETAVLQPDPDKLAFSEKIDSVVEESAERCTRGSVLQIGASGLHPEMKLPTSSADEETVINSKGIPSTELPKEVQPETTESQAYKIAQIIIQNVVAQFQQESMAFLKPKSETAVLCPDPDAVAFSEKIDSELEEQSPEKGTREDALQMGASGSPPEVELPKSSPDEEIEEKVMTSTEIPSTEFPKSAHSEAIESQAYKIVQIIIRNAVAQFQQESMALSKQKRTTVVMYPDPDAAAFSEKIDSMLEGASGERALQMGISGSPSEMELPTSSADDETEEKTVTSAGIPSTEFRKDILPETVESRAYKIVQIIIENAVAQFKRESMTFSKQKSETAVPYPDPGKVAFSEKIDPVLEESAGRCTREDSLQTGALGSPPETKLQKTSFEEKTEENVMALEGIPSTEFPEESGGRCTREGAFLMGTSGSPPEMEMPKSLSKEETEEKAITSECIPSTEFPEELAERCTKEDALQMDTSGSSPEMELPKYSSEEETEGKVMMTSEGIPSTEFPEESAERCTKEDALQTDTSGSPPEMELPKYSSQEKAEQKAMTSEGVSTSTEFSKDVQPETMESESYKIVQKMSAVAQFQQTQEAISPLKQKSELCLMGVNEFGIQEVIQVGQQASMAEEKRHEIRPTIVNAETEEAIEVAKKMPSCSTVSEDRENWNSRKRDVDLETVKEIVNETENKKYDSKPQLKADVVVSTETQNIMLGSIVSGDHPVVFLETEQSTIKDLEVGPIDENQEKLIEHQTQRKRKDYNQLTEFPEMPKEEDTTSGDSPQLQTKFC